MDKPIFSLDRPLFLALDVSRDGQWISVLTRSGIDIYDGNGTHIFHFFSTRGVITAKEHSNVVAIYNEELAYHGDDGLLHIYSMPDFEQIDVYDFSGVIIKKLSFNKNWILYAEKSGVTKAMNRKEEPLTRWIEGAHSAKLVDENTVIFIDKSRRSAQMMDLLTGEVVRNIPAGSIVEFDQHYYAVLDERELTTVYEFPHGQAVGEIELGDTTQFCLDGTHLFTCFSDRHVVLYNIKSGAEIATYSTVEISHFSPALSSTTITQYEADGWIRQYDLFSGEHLRKLDHLPGNPIYMVVSGRYLAMMSLKAVAVFDLQTAKMIWERKSHFILPGDTDHVMNVTIEGSLVVVYEDNQIEIWDFLEDRQIATCPAIAVYAYLSLPYLYFLGWSGPLSRSSQHPQIEKFDIERQTIVCSRTRLPSDPLPLYLSHKFGLIRKTTLSNYAVLDIETLDDQREIEGRSMSLGQIRSGIHPAPCNDDVLLLRTDTGAALISLEGGVSQREVEMDESDELLCISADSQTLVATGDGLDIIFWHPFESSAPVYNIQTRVWILTACFADERTLVTSHIDGTVNFWDITHITQGLV